MQREDILQMKYTHGIMLPFICEAAALLVLSLSLQPGYCLECHYCESHGGTDECLQTSDVICKADQDVCTIQTTWKGSLYNDMNIVKSCSTSDECPPANQTAPSCYKYESGWSCTLCCRESFCNAGANGSVPRPPPYPPIPDPLIQRLTRDCGTAMDYCTTTLSWSEDSGQVQIKKDCAAPDENLADNLNNYAEMCNIPADPGYCVTCCHDNSCVKPTVAAHASRLASSGQTLLLLTCVLVRWSYGS